MATVKYWPFCVSVVLKRQPNYRRKCGYFILKMHEPIIVHIFSQSYKEKRTENGMINWSLLPARQEKHSSTMQADEKYWFFS